LDWVALTGKPLFYNTGMYVAIVWDTLSECH
jgi:hypothetical protein